MKTKELIIEGMSCEHCVMSVRKELSKLAHVNVEDVRIGKARVKYDETKVDDDDFTNAINEAGYTLVRQ
jgi:copper chaperone